MSTGPVNGFTADKDLCFVGVDRDGPGMFAHRRASRADGFRELKERQRVEFDLVQAARGAQAESVRSI